MIGRVDCKERVARGCIKSMLSLGMVWVFEGLEHMDLTVEIWAMEVFLVMSFSRCLYGDDCYLG